MIVDSKNIEFTGELIGVIPYAYWHYMNGDLEATMSASGTEAFYYFSPCHVINEQPRHWANNAKCNILNAKNPSFTATGEWYPPPYKVKYMNDEFVYTKPVLVIANKYNKEWMHNPVNYIDINTIDEIINRFKDKYTIFYNRKIPKVLEDDQVQLKFSDHKMIRKHHPEVRFVEDLEGDFNLNQLRLYANCDRFISVQGGNSVLASYFGGVNVVYAVKGSELDGKFYTTLKKISGCNVIHVKTYDDLLIQLDNLF
jgi:hypothetical protein